MNDILCGHALRDSDMVLVGDFSILQCNAASMISENLCDRVWDKPLFRLSRIGQSASPREFGMEVRI